MTDLRKLKNMSKKTNKEYNRSLAPKYQFNESMPNNRMLLTQQQEIEQFIFKVLVYLSCLVSKKELKIIQLECPRLPNTPTKDLLSVTSAWTEKSKKIADLLYSSGVRAKQNSTINDYLNLFSPLIPLTNRINTIFGNEISSYLLSPISIISPYFGRAVQYFYKYAPHYCLGYCFGHRLYTMYKLRALLKECLENEKLFNEIKKLVTETEILDENIERIFFNEENEAVVNQVEALFFNYRSSMYTFSILCLAAIMITPSVLENPEFLFKLFSFGNSETTDRYYQRFCKDEDPCSLTTTSNASRKNSLGLSLLLDSTVNVRECSIKKAVMEMIPTTVPHYTLETISTTLDFHYAYREFNSVDKDKKYSLYETLFTKTNARLREVNNFMRRYSTGI